MSKNLKGKGLNIKLVNVTKKIMKFKKAEVLMQNPK